MSISSYKLTIGFKFQHNGFCNCKYTWLKSEQILIFLIKNILYAKITFFQKSFKNFLKLLIQI